MEEFSRKSISNGNSWLGFLNEIKTYNENDEDVNSIHNQNIIDENENYNNYLRNTNSNHSNGYKDIRNSFIFKDFPDSTIFNEDERCTLLKSIQANQTNTPTLEGIKSAENNYVRRLALKKNRFSLDNQDYKGSLKLKMASEEIDKLIFSLNTPRVNNDNDNDNVNNNNNNNNSQKSTIHSILEEGEEDEKVKLESINNETNEIVKTNPRKSFSYLEDDFLKNLDIINCRMIMNNTFIEDIKEEEEEYNYGIRVNNEENLKKIMEEDEYDEKFENGKKTIVINNQKQGDKKEEEFEEFLEIKETFMKLGELVPARNEIKMDHLIELSIECEMLEECPICLNEIDSINVFKFSPCSHRYCVDCVRKYFTDLIFRQTEIVCPHPKCDSIVHDFKIKEVVGLTIFKKFEMYKHLKNLKSDNIIYCRSCQNPIPYKAVVALNCSISANGGTSSSSSSGGSGIQSNDGATENNKNGMSVVICDYNGCGTKHCIECLSLEHPDRTCKENQKIIHDALSPEELKTLKYLELNQIKQCPKCGVLCSKADGCEYVMCLTCNYQFCFLCLEVHDHNLANHVHGPKYQEEIITSDNLYGNYYNRGYQNGNKHKKLKKICKNILIGAGIVIATPIAVSVVAVAAIPYGVYYLAKKNEERKKKKKTKKFERWANGEYKRRKEMGVDVSPYIEFAANNYAVNHKAK
ncbi:hypothetical protein ACTFIV_003824 [Dictyostelium citrinum]